MFSKSYHQPELNHDSEDEAETRDIGELLGFRITGGRDFFMPITIFHVNNDVNTTCVVFGQVDVTRSEGWKIILGIFLPLNQLRNPNQKAGLWSSGATGA